MTDTNIIEFSTQFLENLVKAYNEVFAYLSQPCVNFFTNLPFELPNVVTNLLQSFFGDTSLLQIMFGTALTLMFTITIVKWILGIVT